LFIFDKRYNVNSDTVFQLYIEHVTRQINKYIIVL